MLQQLVVEGRQLPGEHALLNGGNAPGGVLLLGRGEGLQKFGCVAHGSPAQQGQKGVLLHVAGEPPLPVPLHDAAVGAGGVLPHTQLLQSQGVKDPHVPGGMLDNRGILRAGPVQGPAVGRRALGQVVLVIARPHDPRSGLGAAVPDKVRHALADLLLGDALPQRGLKQGVGTGGQVAVGVHKGGHQAPPLQIHLSGVRARQGPGLLQLSHVEDVLPLGHQGLGVQWLLHRENGAAVIKCPCHHVFSCPGPFRALPNLVPDCPTSLSLIQNAQFLSL